MGWEARKNAGGEPRGNPRWPKSSAHWLVQGGTVVIDRELRHSHERRPPKEWFKPKRGEDGA